MTRPLPITLEMMMLLNEIGIPSAIAARAIRNPGTSAAIDRWTSSCEYSRETAWRR